ncbi:uncharacterized protein LOC131226260 isoform X2 [Magnolia sinica]|nr:uncharacterized protein LOC131226260 isoform X2 [Magnolia sinica]
MDSVEVDYNEESMEDISAERLLSMASCVSSIYGDPQVLPRVGDQYQVEIPYLTEQWDSQKPTNTKGSDDFDYIPITLPVPVMWVQDVVDHVKYEGLDFHGYPVVSAQYNLAKESRMNSKGNAASQYAADSANHHTNVPDGSMRKFEFWDGESDNGKGFGRPACHDLFGDRMDVDVPLRQCKKSNVEKKHESKDYHPVPGSLGGSWSDIEHESFIVGLYIFGKNLVQVKRFVESKGMGDIQSFYYGQFYRSNGHRRWSECRKMRTRRSIHGQRIFTGWRQQELLSRLLPRVSDDCGNALVEVTRIFGDGKISLEEYVSSLKGMVGLTVLVEAIGIGKGRKHDLTGVVMEPMKTNQVISIRSEIPIGKACSTLTSGDIIRFLTGDFRLSKARSNDLFWEAVWPRLLARGWHSEQPKNHGCVGTKHPLVFLIPGIKKFSRRKLVKGDHYFDSISDVLNKVASDPKLLELEVEAINNGNGAKDEYGWDPNAKLDKMGPSDHQRHCYLRPRTPNCNSEVAKFTIVDTSLLHGAEPYQVKELRSLPVDNTRNLPVYRTRVPITTSSSSESDSDNSSEEQVNEQESADMLLNDKESYPTTHDGNKSGNSLNCMPNKGVHADVLDHVAALQEKGMSINEPDSADLPISDHKDQFPNAWNGGHCRVRVKRPYGARMRSDRRNSFRGRLKLPRLDIYNHAERSQGSSAGPQLKESPHCGPYSLVASDIMVAAVSQGKVCPDESSELLLGEGLFGANDICAAVSSLENQPPRTLIDLNLPHVPPDFETMEPFIAEVTESQNGSNMNGSLFALEMSQQPDHSLALGTSNGVDGADPPIANARRQSTRNRPLTTRVLEAFECGFFNTRRRGRGMKALSLGTSMPRSSRRRARDGVGVSGHVATNSGIVATDYSKVEGVDEEYSSNTNMDTESQIWSEREGAQDLRIPITAYHPEISIGKYEDVVRDMPPSD